MGREGRMSSEHRARAEEIRFADDAHHILESLLREIHKARRKASPASIDIVRSLVNDLVTFAEYQGYDAIWRSLLGLRELPPDDLLDDVEERVARWLDAAKSAASGSERGEAGFVPARQSLGAAMRTMDAEAQRKIAHVMEIHLDIFNNLVHNLADATQRTVYLDSLDNLIFSLRDTEFPALREMLDRHRRFICGPIEAAQIQEIQRDLQTLGHLTQAGRPLELTRKGKTIDLRPLLPDLRVVMYNLRYLIRRAESSARRKGLIESWRTNVNELSRQFRKLGLSSAVESLKRLDRKFKNHVGDTVLLDGFLHLSHVLATEAGVMDDVFSGHDAVLYRDLNAWQTDKQVYRLLDTEYVLPHRTLVETERIPEIMDVAADLTALRSALAALNREARDGGGRHMSHAMDDVTSQLTKLTRRLVKAADHVQRIDGRLLLNRLEREIVRSGKKTRTSVQVWTDDHDARMELALVEDLENPLLELTRQFVDRVAGDESLEIELTLRESTYAYGLVFKSSDAGRGWIDLMAALAGTAPTRTGRLDKFVNDILQYRADASQGIRDFIVRGLDRLRCDIRVEPTEWEIKIPKRQMFANVVILKSGDDYYVIPSFAVKDTRTVGEDQLLTVQGHRMLRHEAKLIMAIPLHQLVHPEKPASGRTIVIVDTPSKPTGLLVDEVIGTDDIAVKPLDDLLRAGQVFSGGAVLADGHIGLFIDPMELGELAQQTEASVREFLETRKAN